MMQPLLSFNGLKIVESRLFTLFDNGDNWKKWIHMKKEEWKIADPLYPEVASRTNMDFRASLLVIKEGNS